jgi:hypothetical protein
MNENKEKLLDTFFNGNSSRNIIPDGCKEAEGR